MNNQNQLSINSDWVRQQRERLSLHTGVASIIFFSQFLLDIFISDL